MLFTNLITPHGYDDFLIGWDEGFDLLASSAIKRVAHNYGYGNTHFSLVLLYMKAEYRNNEKSYLEYYDEVEICSNSAEAHPKSAIQVRNRNLVDRSDFVVCCIQHKSGGAYRTIQYAKKQDKKIVNLADEN